MPLMPSTADDFEVRHYTLGHCHEMAAALHREFGWRILVVTDDFREPYRVHATDPALSIPRVSHVLAVDGEGMAWDICGARPEAEVVDEIKAKLGLRESSVLECSTERALWHYVGTHGGVDRPLLPYAMPEVEAALEVALRVLTDVPGFPFHLRTHGGPLCR